MKKKLLSIVDFLFFVALFAMIGSLIGYLIFWHSTSVLHLFDNPEVLKHISIVIIICAIIGIIAGLVLINKINNNKVFRVLSVSFFTCAIIGSAAGIILWNKPHKRVESEEGVKVTATTLCKAFSDDKNKASTMYLNKALEVTGEVSDINVNQDGGKMVLLKTDDPILAIQCTFRDNGVNVEKGKTIKIKGYYSDFSDITGVLLTDCVLIK